VIVCTYFDPFVQDISHESAFAKRLKTKHNSDTEQDVKHSDDEELDEETTCKSSNQEEWVNILDLCRI
jgi:hypothetical protein